MNPSTYLMVAAGLLIPTAISLHKLPAVFVLMPSGPVALPSCPLQVTPDQAAPNPAQLAPKRPATKRPSKLRSITLSLATDGGFAEQMGDYTKLSNGYKNTYSGLHETARTAPLWVSCNYGASNELSLVHRLPPYTDRCTVTYSPKGVSIGCTY